MVAVSCNPYEESKEHGRPQAAKKSPVGSFLVFGFHPVGMSTVVAAAKTRTESNRAAVRSTATKAPVGLWLARGSQRLGMSTVVAAVSLYAPSREKGVAECPQTFRYTEL